MNEPIRSWGQALAYEKSQQALADILYKEIWPNKIIRRPDFCANKHDRELQEADVDVVVTNKEGGQNPWYISEKFRTQPYNDILIELWADYEHNKPGWAELSIAHEHYFYHNSKTPFVRIVPTWAIKKMARRFKEEFGAVIAEMYKAGDRARTITLGSSEIILRFIPTKKKGRVLYNGVCAIIPLEVLGYFNANEKIIDLCSQEKKLLKQESSQDL